MNMKNLNEVMKKITGLVLLLSGFIQIAYAQKNQNDSTEAVKAFFKVASFSWRPNIYYEASTTAKSNPILQASDTLSFTGEFYKSDSGVYVRNGKDEIFQQDGYVVKINNGSKSISVEKWEKFQDHPGIIPFDSVTLSRMLKENYLITQERATSNTYKIRMKKTNLQQSGEVNSEVLIVYDNITYLPIEIDLTITLRRKVNQDEIQNIKDKGFPIEDLVESVGDENFLIRNQEIKTVFRQISDSKDKVKTMPKWKDKLFKVNNEFITKGTVKGYHVEAN